MTEINIMKHNEMTMTNNNLKMTINGLTGPHLYDQIVNPGEIIFSYVGLTIK